jgi:hypothetical protein
MHPCRCGCDGAVVVENGQHKRFEEETSTKRTVDSKHRASRHIEITFAIAPYFAFKPEGMQMFKQFVCEAPQPCQVLDLSSRKLETSEQFCQTSRSSYYSVPSPVGQSTREDFKRRPP